MRKLLCLIFICQFTPAFTQNDDYNNPQLNLAFDYYLSRNDSLHSVYIVQMYNISDTTCYNIDYVDDISIVFLRIPSYYCFLKDKLVLIQTGIEVDKKSFNEYNFNVFYELLKKRLNNDVEINSYYVFEYTIIESDVQEYTTGNSYTVFMKDNKIIKYEYTGGLHFYPVNYKRHFKIEKRNNP